MTLDLDHVKVHVEQDQQEGEYPHLVRLTTPGFAGEALTSTVIYSTKTVPEAVIASDIAEATLRGLARLQGATTT